MSILDKVFSRSLLTTIHDLNKARGQCCDRRVNTKLESEAKSKQGDSVLEDPPVRQLTRKTRPAQNKSKLRVYGIGKGGF